MKITRFCKAFLTLPLLAGAAFTALPAGAQTTYTLTDLSNLPGPVMVAPSAINNQTQIAGTSITHALRYSQGMVQDLGTLPGGNVSGAAGINGLGDVVGSSQYLNSGAIVHATLWRANGTVQDLGSLTAFGNVSTARDVNDSLQVAGYSAPTGGNAGTINDRAFIWDATHGLQDIGTLGGQYSAALSINNAGMMTGNAQVPTGFGPRHAFIWQAATGMQDLGTLGGETSLGVFINEAGHVVGDSTINSVDNRTHGFLYDGVMHDLGSLSPGSEVGDFSSAYGINLQDTVVGTTYRTVGGSLQQTAFVYQNGTMSALEDLVDASGSGYRLVVATAINDAGQITAQAIELSSNANHAVLLTPASSSGETITITKAAYTSRQHSLTVQATDATAGATLQVYVTATDTLLGTLKKRGTSYSGKFSVATKPASITVKSSLGGSATAPVTGR